MTITSAQENILDNIVITLKTINATGNYNLNLGTNVWRKFRHYSGLDGTDFPCAIVIDESDTIFEPLTALDITTGSQRQDITRGWPITIIGYVQADDDIDFEGLLQKEMIKMFSDVVIAMLVDKTRGGYALSTVLIGKSKSVDWNVNVGGIAITFAIKYDFNPNASTPTT